MAKKSKVTAVATKAPTGLSISRNGNTFTCSWKIGDSDYKDGQQFYWNLNGKRKWGVAGIGKGDTSRNISVNLGTTACTSIVFGVRGNRTKYKSKKKTYEPGWSAWATKTYTMAIPDAPSVSYELNSNNAYAGKFTWSIDNVDNSNNKQFRKYEWESILVYKHNSTSAPTNWSDGGSADGEVTKGSGTAISYSWEKFEDTALWNDPDASYARWFRIRSVGAAGASAWRYAHHVYAIPRSAYDVTAKAIPKAGDVGYSVVAEWTAPESTPYPIDEDIVLYAVVKPTTVAKPVSATYELTEDTEIVDGKIYYTRSGEEGSYIYTVVETPDVSDIANYYELVGGTMVTTMDYPAENPSWTTAGTIKDTASRDAMAFSIPEILGDDECIFVKVNTKHDSAAIFETSGVPVLAEGGVGPLAKPKVKQIVPNPSTHRVQIVADNNSDLDASFLAIYYRTEDAPDTYQTIGILKHANTQITVQCPDWGDKEFSIGVQCLIADYSPIERSSSGVTEYTITNIRMKSDISWDEGRVPMPPKYVELSSPNSTTIRVLWDWTWTEANKTELSWADHEDAWESTDGPQTYEVTDLFAGAWNIAGVAVGTWYVRARLIREDEDSVLYGLYSDIKQIKLSSSPAIPSLILSSGVVHEEGEVTCYWAYISTDGTSQMQADICEATLDSETNEYTYGEIVGMTASAQHLTLSVKELGWKAGETHYLAVRVISASGEQSQGWSTPVPIKVAEPLTVNLKDTSIIAETVAVEEPTYILTSDTEIDTDKTYYTRSGEEEPYTYTVVSSPSVDDISTYYELSGGLTVTTNYLTDLPLTFTIDSKGASEKTTVYIERSEDYHMRRPDDSELDGYKGEIVVSKTFDGDGTYTITVDDLIGYLDDGATYNLIASGKGMLDQTSNTYLQSAESTPIVFTVRWGHQAIVPAAECEMDTEHYAAILKPMIPEELPDGYSVQDGDVCDIYRLSVDAPELIYENAEFGKRYVDPYPTLGENGGHRFVYKTKNGDYTTKDNHIAFYDTNVDENDFLDLFSVLIDYNGEQISLPYNIQLSSRWAKDFQQTNYLGGSIQGDWNPAVSRTGSVSTVGIVTDEFGIEELDGTIDAVRRLANYAGICHVRTPDGSSYSANINVSEDREEKMINKIAKYSLEITAVDSEELDGVTYEVWKEMNREEE